MKKLIISALFILFTATTLVQASDRDLKKDDGIEKVSSNVLRHFGYTFYRATNVSWTVNKTYQKATFLLNGKTTYAIYDLDNNFLVATQLTETSELPAKTQESLKADYGNYKVANILKVIERPANYQLSDDTDSYWLDLVNEKEHVIAIAFPNTKITTVKVEQLN